MLVGIQGLSMYRAKYIDKVGQQGIDFQVRGYRGCETKLETDFDNGRLLVSETYFSLTLAFRQHLSRLN